MRVFSEWRGREGRTTCDSNGGLKRGRGRRKERKRGEGVGTRRSSYLPPESTLLLLLRISRLVFELELVAAAAAYCVNAVGVRQWEGCVCRYALEPSCDKQNLGSIELDPEVLCCVCCLR
ncbi:hypothetical protein BDZ91DRAFT_746785 [Kalaharituber pfeilii]|nr:hypothetical protein BDZ91DRAFT_746785 [Kalaharituber pfeilii]